MLKILVIDDEKPTLSMFRLFLTAYGYEVLVAEEGKKGVEIFEQERPQIVFTDIKMPGMDGIEVLRKIRSSDTLECNRSLNRPDRSDKETHSEDGDKSCTQVIVITGHGDIDKAIEALDLEASDFINKPVEKRALESALKRAELRLRIDSTGEDLKSSSDPIEDPIEEQSSTSGRSSDSHAENSYDDKNRSEIVHKSDSCLHLKIEGRLTASSPSVLQINKGRKNGIFENISKIFIHFSPDFSISRDGFDWLINLMSFFQDQSFDITMDGLSYNYIRFFQMAGLHEIAHILESQIDE